MPHGITPYNNVYNSVALQSLILTTVQSCKFVGMRKVLQSIATEIILFPLASALFKIEYYRLQCFCK